MSIIRKREVSQQGHRHESLLGRVIHQLKITSMLKKGTAVNKGFDPFTIPWADEREALEEFSLFIKRELYPLFGSLFKMGTFASYKEEAILDVLIYMAINETTSENGARAFKDEYKKESPSPRTIRCRLGKMEFSEVVSAFSEANKRILSFFQNQKGFDVPVLLAIDPTHVPCYGKRRKYACGMKRERGTNYGYEYGACVAAGRGVILHTVPMTQFDSNEKMLEELIGEAKKYVDIEIALLDREFFNEPCIRKLESSPVKYLMPAKKMKEILKLKPPCKAEVPLGSMYVPVIAVRDPKDQKKTLYYCTNIDVPGTLEEVIDVYRHRWTVENAFKSEKSFLAKTYSVNFTIRFFFWALAHLLHNAWVLCNVCACTDLKVDPAAQERPLITAFRFGIYMKSTFLSPLFSDEPERMLLAALVIQYLLRNLPQETILHPVHA